jgi:hypothetical protein
MNVTVPTGNSIAIARLRHGTGLIWLIVILVDLDRPALSRAGVEA